MAGYAAVISLRNTIQNLQQSSRISLAPPFPRVLQIIEHKLGTLTEILKRLDNIEAIKSRKKVNALDGRIKEVVWEFEDLLESHLCNNLHASQFSIDLNCLQNDVKRLMEKLKDLQEEYASELHNMPPVESDELVSSEFDSAEEMVGLSDVYERVRDYFMIDEWACGITLLGMPGIGKTTLAKKLFQDPEVSRRFDHRVWVTVGRNYEMNEIAGAILAQLDPNAEEVEELKARFKKKRCLIVLDDVWDNKFLEYMETYLPDNIRGAKFGILITSRLAYEIPFKCSYPFSAQAWMRLLNVEESHELLRWRVFGEKGFPSEEIKEAAEKIAKKCEGLPLMILKVAHCLSRSSNKYDPEYWNEVANKRRSSIFMEAYGEISEVLFPTYDCLLSQFAKQFCICLGAFPHDYEIRMSKVINIMIAERNNQGGSTNFDSEHSLAYFYQILSVPKETIKLRKEAKSFKIYSWWWHLFNREAYRNKINRIFYSYEVEEGIIGHRRLCLHTNFLFNFKNIHDTVKHDCASTARSLFCFGPYHQYSMPLDLGFKLLRVLDALGVRFYSFPVEILVLVFLQYLALSCNGKLPTSVSKLFSLQFLIIHPHKTVKSIGQTSFLPVQIWDMHELTHIEVLGGNLPKPNSDGSLNKLSKLLGVSPESCTREVLEKIPNIKKLGIQMELSPNNEPSNPLYCFDHISELQNLESLKYSIVNPEMSLTLTPISKFPSQVQKLVLSGLGYSWEYMKVIGSLPHLKVLKLRSYAFRGPKWETESGSFVNVEELLIEDTDLVQCKLVDGSFPKLRILCIKFCYRLEELVLASNSYGTVIELVDCNPLAVACAKKLKGTKGSNFLEVLATFDNKKLTQDELEIDFLETQIARRMFAVGVLKTGLLIFVIFTSMCIILIFIIIVCYFSF